ncbi:MAG: alpha/beta fold hydrolase [Pirellulales bacterium]|nr:alpha/beta fold hydrolase [Pirellulales bacterium]
MEQVDLEVRKVVPNRLQHEHPILFVHGAWHNASGWERHFFPFFRDRGYTCYALSLRNHGTSARTQPINRVSISDYVTDIRDVVQGVIKQDPILIGHSMGGFLVQKYLEQHPVAAAVLLASVPPSGTKRCSLRMFRKFPMTYLGAIFSRNLYRFVDTPKKVRTFFLSQRLPDDRVADIASQMDSESYRASIEMLRPKIELNYHQRVPMFVTGAENDALFSPDEVQMTADKYKADFQLFPDLAHDIMLDADWEIAADSVCRWLEQREQIKSLKC